MPGVSDKTVREFLQEQLHWLKEGLPEEADVASWLDDPDVEMFKDLDTDLMIDVSFAYGYLRGVADIHETTVLDLLQLYGLLEPKAKGKEDEVEG